MRGALAAIGTKLARREDLTDGDFWSLLAELDGGGGAAAAARSTSSAAHAPWPLPGGDGGMRLARREVEIRASEDGCQPAVVRLQAGGTCTIAVRSGPPQSFTIGRDVEEAFATPAIPCGSSYTWTPPEPGSFVVRSEIYPHLSSCVKVLGTTPPGAPPAAQPFASGGMAAAAVEDFIRFPLLGPRPGVPLKSDAAAGEPASLSQGTQTGASRASRQASAAGAPGLSPGRFGGSSSAGSSSDEEEVGGLLDPPPDSGLRRRTRAGAAADAAPAPAASRTVLPPLTRHALPSDAYGLLSAGSGLSTGSGESPPSGSGSERSGASAPLYVHRRVPGGMLSSTRAFSVAGGSAAYSDGRSSEEAQPLLYSVGAGRGQHLPAASYQASYRPDGAPPAEPRPPTLSKCPRCGREYLSTINQRRCLSSHLGGRCGRGGSAQDAKALAEFWDGLGEGEKREVLELGGEHNSELITRQLEAQLLHRKRDGQLDGLTKEQRRLHTAGKMLHGFCGGAAAGLGGAPFSGSNLVSVLSQVSEGTFLCGSNTIDRAELAAGDNLEAALGALVTKRLVEAQLRAKQRAAELLQRELEDLETAQAAKKGGASGQAPAAAGGKKKAKGKGKGKAPAAKPAAKPPPAAAAAATPAAASPAGSEADAGEEATARAAAEAEAPGAAPPAPDARPAASGGTLSPPDSNARYGGSPARAASSATCSFTNVLFAAKGEAPPGEGVSVAAGTARWCTSGAGRPAACAPHAGEAPKASGGAQGAAKGGSPTRTGRSSGVPAATADRPAAKPAADRGGSVAPAAPKPALTQQQRSAPAAAAGVPSTSKLAAQNRLPSTGGAPRAQVQREGFPALPTAAAGAAAGKPAPPAPASNGVAFSYAAAAAAAKQQQQKAAGKPAAKQQPAAPSASAAASETVAASAAEQGPSMDAAAPEPAPQPAAAAVPPAELQPPAPEPTAATAPEAAKAAEPAAGAEAAVPQPQRPASVTPPISDAGSPPPGPLAPPPGAYHLVPHGWVGPDGAMLPPPPVGYFWPMPPPPPGMQFGSVEMQEVVGYPPFHPAYFHAAAPYPLPPGHPGAPVGVPPPPPHVPGYSGAPLAPFPAGMPLPLPPEAAEELAAAAAAHAAAAAGSQQQWQGEDPLGGPLAQAPEEGEEAALPPATVEDSAGPAPEPLPQRRQPGPRPERRSSFLEMLREACGGPPPQPAAAQAPRRGAQRHLGFDAEAAAAEFERRWQSAAPKLASGGTRPVPKQARAGPAAKAGTDMPRVGSAGGGKGAVALLAKAGAAAGGGSGRSSPRGVVVAVRASSGEARADGARWTITAKQSRQR